MLPLPLPLLHHHRKRDLHWGFERTRRRMTPLSFTAFVKKTTRKPGNFRKQQAARLNGEGDDWR